MDAVSVEQYLSTAYRPDCDYVDGLLVERNVGEKSHSRAQRQLIVSLGRAADEYGIEVYPSLRVRVSSSRFRVPDIVVVLRPDYDENIVTTTPHLCVEILSKDDTMEEMQERIADYLAFGVPYIWIISPRHRKGYIVTSAGMVEAKDGVLATGNPAITVPLADIFLP